MNEYTVKWSAEDGDWVGLCDRYPDFSFTAADPLEALRGILELIKVEEVPAVDPGVKYCPKCGGKFFIGFISDGSEGWGWYNWHVEYEHR